MNGTQTMALNEIVDSKRWLMWFSAALFYFYQFILRVSPSVMTEELQSYLLVSGCALGALTSLYYWGYSLFQIPVGIIMDRVGTRMPLTIAFLMSEADLVFVNESANCSSSVTVSWAS